MSNFADRVKQDTPRLVVTCHLMPDGDTRFAWGMVGGMPALSTLGCILRVQQELLSGLFENRDCPERALVIAYYKRDDGGESFDWYVHKDIPTEQLVGMLETIKVALMGSAQRTQAVQQANPGLLGPDGRPFNFKR